jgi:hypothetical protein
MRMAMLEVVSFGANISLLITEHIRLPKLDWICGESSEVDKGERLS